VNLPVFIPAPVPRAHVGTTHERPDHGSAPLCATCRRLEAVDVASGCCRSCWRVVVLLPAVLRAERQRDDGPPVAVVVDEIALARVARDGKPLAIETRANEHGVSLEVDLGALTKPPR
jgi:hypothetical protein